MFSFFIFIILIIIVFCFTLKGFKCIHQGEVMIIERLGRYWKTLLQPGWHWINPVLDAPRKIEWKETKLLKNGEIYSYVVFKDRINLCESFMNIKCPKSEVGMDLNISITYRITDAKQVAYEVYNLQDAIEKLSKAVISNQVAENNYDISDIKSRLRITFEEASMRWGIQIIDIFIEENR